MPEHLRPQLGQTSKPKPLSAWWLIEKFGVKRATLLNICVTFIMVGSIIVPLALYYQLSVLLALLVNVVIHLILLPQTYQTYQMMDELNTLRGKLYTSSITDFLTQVYNRQHFMEYLEWHFASAKRWGLAFAVILLDIDHFKTVNDHYGHEAGDEALRTVSALCQTQVRQVDIFARYGGEEFIFLLAQITPEQAMASAERIRAKISQTPINCGQTAVPITVSLGVAVYHASLPDSDALLSAADEALYRAKRQGRNQAVLADPLAEPNAQA